MNVMTYQQALQVLRQAGLVKTEIDQLYQFRQTYQANELDQPPLDTRQLEFVRWLVATGRLTDQLPDRNISSFSIFPRHWGLHFSMRSLFFFSSRIRKESK